MAVCRTCARFIANCQPVPAGGLWGALAERPLAKLELNDLETVAIENAKRAARATDEAVHEHPYAAMAIAAGIGALIGMLIVRR